MMFKVNLVTSGGAKREIDLEATSVQDAIDQVNLTYKNCYVTNVDLIPKKGQIRLFWQGEQIEASENSLYVPFK